MNLICWFWKHKWEPEVAILNSGYQCSRCKTWQGGDDTVLREREAWVRILNATGTADDKARWTPLVIRELMKDRP